MNRREFFRRSAAVAGGVGVAAVIPGLLVAEPELVHVTEHYHKTHDGNGGLVEFFKEVYGPMDELLWSGPAWGPMPW